MADASVLPPPRSRLILERVLGLTALSNAMVAVNPVSGELAYAAGCIVVVYNLRRNKQVRYYRVDKSVACLCFSPNGQFLAIGEKGYLPAITIWDGTVGTLCAELQRHQYGVACMAFSQDGRFLLSVGLVHDQHLYAWELKFKRKETIRRLEVTAVGCAFVEDKVLDADYCQAGNFFVTVGEKHFKYWFLDDNGSFLVTGHQVNELPELQYRDAVVNAKTSSTFTSVACGYGACEVKTFAVTSDGTLCCFGASGIMERLVSLESSSANAISVTESYVAVGGSSGIVRMFSPSTLEYCTTLPFPPAFGSANESSKLTPTLPNVLYPADPFRYPAAIATRITGSHVIVFYSDRSIFIYSTTNLDAVIVERSFLYHSGGIRDLQVVGFVRGINAKGKLVYSDSGGVSADTIPTGTFVTCSDDNTVRLWNLELHRRLVKSSRFEQSDAQSEHEYWKNPYSQEMLRVIYNDHERDFADEHYATLGGTCSHEATNSVHSPPKANGRNKGLWAMAVRPDQREIASGDQEGNVVVIPLPLENPIIRIGAHSSKVNCLAYSSLNNDGIIFMASGGKDRLIQLYDCQKRHTVLSTLESHSAAVTNVSLSHDGKSLLSCDADNVVSLAGIDVNGKVTESKVLPFGGGKVFDMVLLPDNDTVVASCNNKLEILSASTGKQQQTLLVGEQHRVALCPANYCVAMSGSLAERTIHVVDITTGDTIATGTGHSEAVTALKFTPDCRRLLSASSDGCIFVWRLADDIQAEIKAKLPRVIETPKQAPPPSPVTKSEQQLSAMPPPAPPISRPSNEKNTVLSGAPSVPSSPVAEVGQTSQPSEGDKATPKRVSKRSPPKWKGNGVAVPGPMAGIPMEEWMRTRATAKPTIHVVDEVDQIAGMKTGLKAPSNNGILAIDRLQTPEWARTAQPGSDSGQPVPNSSPGVEAVSYQVPAHGKWGSKIASSLPSSSDASTTNASEPNIPSFQQTSIEGEHILAVRTSASSIKTDKEELTNLSVEIIDTSPKMSSSLALEREQLEKRKKQIDTVNAVATMNTRLSQLGLLKALPVATSTSQSTLKAPSPLKRQIVAEDNHTSDVRKLPIPEVAMSPGSDYDANKSKPSQVVKLAISESSAETIPAQEIKPTISENVSADREPEKETKSSVSDVTSVGTMSSQESMPKTSSGDDVDKFTNDLVSQALQALNSEEPPRPLPVDVVVDVAASLSVHVSGYDSHTKKSPGDSDKGKNLPNLPPLVEVDASLSTFTSGFVASGSSKEVAMSSVAMSEPVTSSLSAFTMGYGSDTKAIQADAVPSVKPSESVTIVQGSQQIPVDISLSNFTSGYGTAKNSNITNTIDTNEAVRPPTVVSANAPDTLKSTASEMLANLCQPLDDAAGSLEKLSSDQGQADPKLQEIQKLIAALRSSIRSSLTPS